MPALVDPEMDMSNTHYDLLISRVLLIPLRNQSVFSKHVHLLVSRVVYKEKFYLIVRS